MSLLYAMRALDALQPANGDQKVGIDIFRRALQWPTRVIAANGGYGGAVVIGRLLERKNTNFDSMLKPANTSI
jgi:chaperonin GroEL